jgi:hypothetical protein
VRGHLAAVAVAAVGCARTLPPDRPTASLYRDLERLVTVAETSGWGIDRQETEGMLGAALDSVCRVDPIRRTELLRWIDDEIARRGGPVEQAWRKRGKKLSRVEDLLTLTRIRRVLEAAITSADADCPFWIEPDAAFAGRQISDDRWQLSGGGGGKGMLVVQGGQGDLNFGGAGRAMFGRTFGARAGVYLGVELGASASFPKDDAGTRQGLVLGVDAVTMGVYRHRLVNAYVELEAGHLAHVSEDELAADELGGVDHGVHVGAALGGRSTRTRFFFPGAAFGLSYERTFPAEGPALQTVKVGFRVAFDVDF